MNRRLRGSLLLIGSLAGTALYAQTRPVAPPRPAPARQPAPKTQARPGIERPTGPDDKKLYFETNEETGVLRWETTPKGQIATLRGEVVFYYKDTTLHTEQALYNQTEKVATSPGALQIDDAQNTLTGDSGVAYYKLRIARIQGNVKIVARPKPADPKATGNSLRREFKSPVTITCDAVQYNWRDKVATPTGNIKIAFSHEKRQWTVTSDRLEYRGKEEKAILNGNVTAVSDKGDEIHGASAEIILTEGAERMRLDSPRNSRVNTDEIEEEEDAPPPTPKGDGAP